MREMRFRGLGRRISRRLLPAACGLLLSCGGGPPEEPPEAKEYYERALSAKAAGDEARYRAILERLADSYEDSKYGRRAALILSTPAFSAESDQAEAFEDFRKKIREAGIRETLRQIFEAERAYYSTPRTGVFDEKLPARFIAAGPTPPEVPRARAALPPAPGFDEPGWRTLKFSQPGPMRYQYAALTQGEGPGAKLIIRALGDLDGDGVYSVYELHAEADSGGQVSQKGDILVRDEGE
jgi:hypothetical protein